MVPVLGIEEFWLNCEANAMTEQRKTSLRGRYSLYFTLPGSFLLTAVPLSAYLALSAPWVAPHPLAVVLLAAGYLLVERWAIRLTSGPIKHSYSASELPLLFGVLILHPVLHLAIRFAASAAGTAWRVHRNPAIHVRGAAVGNGVLGVSDVAVFAGVLSIMRWDSQLDATGTGLVITAWIIHAVIHHLSFGFGQYLAGQGELMSFMRRSLRNTVEISLATLAFGLLIAIGRSLLHTLVALTLVGLLVRPFSQLLKYVAEGDSYRALDRFFNLLGRTDASNVEQALDLISESTKCRQVDLVIIEREGLDRTLDSALLITRGSRVTVSLDELPELWRSSLDPLGPADMLPGLKRTSVICPLIVSEQTVGLLVCSEPFDGVRGVTTMTAATATRLAQNLSLWLEQDRLLGELRRDMEERTRQALHDPLTGLLNRRGLAEAWAEHVTDGDCVAVLLIDLDNFKEVNSYVGHDGGDQVLVEAAQRIRKALPARAHVARIGGDEFAAIIPALRHSDDNELNGAGALGVRVRTALASSHSFNGREVVLAGSIGISLQPHHGSDLGTLLRHADAALFAAKDDSDAGVAVFADATYGHDAQAIAIDGYRLKAAIDNGDVHVHFQPIVDMHTFKVTGFEALARWHERGRLVMPQQFIALAEKTGHIHALTERVMFESFAQIVRWRELTGRDLHIGINVSPMSISHPGTFAALESALERTGLDPAAVFLEVTESRMFKDPMRATVQLNHLRTTGVNISLDDFGTGASTHEWLLRMAPNQIKIDRLFIKDMVDDERAAGIVELDVQTGLKFRASVVAEGIETAAHWHKAKSLGVPLAQGYLIARPKPGREIMDWMRAEEPQLEQLIMLAGSLDSSIR